MTEGPPLHLTSKSETSNETLEPVPLGESHKHVGGISVEESRDLMRKEDLIDRKVERQRIKSKHKEQRRKVKKRRREQVISNPIPNTLSINCKLTQLQFVFYSAF